MSSRRVSDVPVDLGSGLRVVLGAGGALLVLRGLAADPAWVETVYVRGWGAELAATLAWVSGGVPVSVAEIGLFLLIGYELIGLLEAIAEVGAGRRGLGNALAAGLRHVAQVVFALLLVFYAAWGVSYARAPALERLGLPTPPALDDPAGLARAREVAEIAVEATNASYLALHGRTDAGAPTAPRKGLDVDRALERGFAATASAYDLGEAYARARPAHKQPFLGDVLSWLGIGGVYVPFTGEATVNGGPPDHALVFTIAHEKAHQRMVASEDEASFFGFLALVRSDEPLLRYAGWHFAARQLLRSLRLADPEAAAAVEARLLPGALRDEADVRAYWAPFDGFLDDLHRQLNDVYLRANRVEGGVLAYSRAGRLVAAWLDTPDGRAHIPRDRASQGR